MPTRTFPANKSSLFAVTGSSELGGGQDDHLPVGGPWNGYTFTSAVRFALDFSGMKAIQSAVLRLRTSSQVHVGFSSTPDFYVSRCSGDWTANSASSSSEGGSGWSTAATNYPGPAATTTGRVGKRAPTSEGSTFDVDITAIVKAWAPSAIPGGGNGANYGVLLTRQASGDVTEFGSYHGTGPPQIIVTYTTDSPPPAPTITGPTGTVGTLRPTLTATAVDPDGDPLTDGDVEVYKAAALVYSAAAVAAADATSLSHVPTADLPSGALTVRWRARAAGVYGAWSAQAPFTVDRPATVTSWTAPVGSIGGNLRPVHTWVSADPDGDAITAWDLEVYQAAGGAPISGTPAVYSAVAQASGIAGMTVSHTPTANLPPGALVARSRVVTAGVYSAWSAWQPYTIVTNNPSAWVRYPSHPGGSFLYIGPLPDPNTPLLKIVFRFQTEGYPPSGSTLTSVSRQYRRLSGPGAPVVSMGGNFTNAPAGGVFSQPTSPSDLGYTTPWGLGEVTSVFTAANGGVTTVVSQGRFGLGEWFGAVFLGDHVSALSVPVEVPPTFTQGASSEPTDTTAVYYRAQVSPTAPNGAAPWRLGSAIATVLAELPAVGAYLGICIRVARMTDPNLIQDGGPADLGPWTSERGTVVLDGAYLRLTASGAAPNATAIMPDAQALRMPIADGTQPHVLRCSAYGVGGATNTGLALVACYNAAGAFINFALTVAVPVNVPESVVTTTGVLPAGTKYVIPRFHIDNGPAAGVWFRFRRFELFRQDMGAWPGFDKLGLSWRSDG